MLSLEVIRKKLADRNLTVIKDATELSYNTIASVRDDPNANPTHKTMKALSDYFENQDAETTE